MTYKAPEGWEEVKLRDIARYINDKVTISECKISSYISTSNMIENKAGIVEIDELPRTKTVNSFKINDILISNIRPYFKKIWFAEFNGTSSSDVLIIRGNDTVDEIFLYYVLSSDRFFDYATKTSKGTKMPRGDKNAILQYKILLPPLQEQKAIADTLSALDDKIELNNKINKNLEAQAQAIFKSWFIDFEPFQDGEFIESELGMIPKGWEISPLADLIDRIDNRGKTPPYAKGKTEFPLLDVATLRGNSRIIDYDTVTKYVSEETYNNWFRSGHPQNGDILISTVGSLAELKLFIGDIGCIAQNVVALRSNHISTYYLYEYLKFIKNDLVSYDIGSVQPSIKITHIIKHPILVPEQKSLQKYHDISEKMTKKIYTNRLENQKLSQLRDTLLPKLISGEIRIPLDK